MQVRLIMRVNVAAAAALAVKQAAARKPCMQGCAQMLL
jgi:hypothetical protein